jgi:hypothetical protein
LIVIYGMVSFCGGINMWLSIEDVIDDVIAKKYLNRKNNNYAFLELSDDQIKKIRRAILDNPIAEIIYYPKEWYGYENKGSLNLLYDCVENSIDELLDYREVNRSFKKQHSNVAVNIINLQEINDIAKLKELNETIMKSREYLSFNLFTKDFVLKEHFTKSGKILDWRDNLAMVRIETNDIETDIGRIKKIDRNNK